MSKLLYIQASPRTKRSHSIKAANAFLSEFHHINPDAIAETINLFSYPLPEMDNVTVQGKYNIMHGKDSSDEEKGKWSAVEKVIEEFKSADKYLFAVPMWNFSIPYKLKHFLDVVIQPSYTFEVGEDGYNGLLKDKSAIVVYASGGAYTEEIGNTAYDFQKPYLELALNFMGIEKIETIVVAPTLQGGLEAAEIAEQKALEKAKQLAVEF